MCPPPVNTPSVNWRSNCRWYKGDPVRRIDRRAYGASQRPRFREASVGSQSSSRIRNLTCRDQMTTSRSHLAEPSRCNNTRAPSLVRSEAASTNSTHSRFLRIVRVATALYCQTEGRRRGGLHPPPWQTCPLGHTLRPPQFEWMSVKRSMQTAPPHVAVPVGQQSPVLHSW